MPKADIINITSATRRSMLSLGAAAAVVGPATVIRFARPGIQSLCADFDALQRSKHRVFDMPSESDADFYRRDLALEAIEIKQEPMVERMSAMRATTMDDHRARARSIAGWLGKDQLAEDAESCCWDKRMVAALVRDLATG